MWAIDNKENPPSSSYIFLKRENLPWSFTIKKNVTNSGNMCTYAKGENLHIQIMLNLLYTYANKATGCIQCLSKHLLSSFLISFQSLMSFGRTLSYSCTFYKDNYLLGRSSINQIRHLTKKQYKHMTKSVDTDWWRVKRENLKRY